MLYKHLVMFIVFILLMFSIHYVKPKPPVREGFFDDVVKWAEKAGKDLEKAYNDVTKPKSKSKPKPKPKPKPPTFRWWWSEPNANGWGKNMSGVDVVSKSYYDKQVKKKEEFYNEHRWECLPWSDVPVRIHPYNKYILEQHPSSMRGNRDKKTKICKGYSPIVYDKNAQHGDPNKRPPNTRYKVNWSSLFRGIGDLNDDYGEEPVGNKGGGFYRLNEFYNSKQNKGELKINGASWEYWYEYKNGIDNIDRKNATHIVLRRNGKNVTLKIPDTVKKLNDTYGVYCANHLPEESFYYTEKGIGSSEEWPDDAMLTNFNCNTGPFPPQIRKTDIFKESEYLDDRTGKPIHENVKRYSSPGSKLDNLVLECKEDSINGRPDNCRNPALWEKRCKAISKLCEKNLPFALENAASMRINSDGCDENSTDPMCLIHHPNCSLTNDNKRLTCEDILTHEKHGYDKSNPGHSNYWKKDIYKQIKEKTTEPPQESRMGGNARAGRGKGGYNRTRSDDYFKNKEIYGKFVDFAELPIGSGILR